ncbi:MAG TPA: hypothetical protein PK297_00280 [Spirochaetota bacterium]|nr:hypothetical protein [Spirochaetota bacterium]
MEEAFLALAILTNFTAIATGIMFILILINSNDALKRCKPENRTMSPGLVFLNFIPVFNLVWGFITVVKVVQSLTKEYASFGETPSNGLSSLGIITEIIFILTSIVAIPLYILSEQAGDYVSSDEVAILLVLTVFTFLFTVANLVVGFTYNAKLSKSHKYLLARLFTNAK